MTLVFCIKRIVKDKLKGKRVFRGKKCKKSLRFSNGIPMIIKVRPLEISIYGHKRKRDRLTRKSPFMDIKGIQTYINLHIWA